MNATLLALFARSGRRCTLHAGTRHEALVRLICSSQFKRPIPAWAAMGGGEKARGSSFFCNRSSGRQIARGWGRLGEGYILRRVCSRMLWCNMLRLSLSFPGSWDFYLVIAQALHTVRQSNGYDEDLFVACSRLARPGVPSRRQRAIHGRWSYDSLGEQSRLYVRDMHIREDTPLTDTPISPVQPPRQTAPPPSSSARRAPTARHPGPAPS